MNFSKEKIKGMVIINIIDNCKMEIDEADQEQYSLNEKQFGNLVETLVENIEVIKNNHTRCCTELPETLCRFNSSFKCNCADGVNCNNFDEE